MMAAARRILGAGNVDRVDLVIASERLQDLAAHFVERHTRVGRLELALPAPSLVPAARRSGALGHEPEDPTTSSWPSNRPVAPYVLRVEREGLAEFTVSNSSLIVTHRDVANVVDGR